MEELKKLLSLLDSKKYQKREESIKRNFEKLKEEVLNIKKDIDDEMLNAMSEDRNDDILPLISIRKQIPCAVDEIDKFISVYLTLNNESIDSTDNVSEKHEEFTGIISSSDELKVGIKMTHRTYGLGVVKRIEERDKTKVVYIEFDCGEKPFELSDEVLNRFFENYVSAEEEIAKKREERLRKKEEKENMVKDPNGYNLYTNADTFTHTKPYMVQIFENSYNVDSWKAVAVAILSYFYDIDKDALLNMSKNIANLKFSDRVEVLQTYLDPVKVGPDGYAFESRFSAAALYTVCAKVADEFINILNKDVRKGIKIFIK